MDKLSYTAGPVAQGNEIIKKAERVGLDPRLLYEAVIDLSTEGLITANCINIAAGILLEDLGLPKYFFEHIQKESLVQLLKSIATSIKIIDGAVTLYERVANIDFSLAQGLDLQRIRIATEVTRDNMEKMLEGQIAGHRREYYYSGTSGCHTYIIRPETVGDFSKDAFTESRFLFSLAGSYAVTPEPTRKRYETFLVKCEQAVVPYIEVFNLPETGETRLMFMSDFEKPQLPLMRKLLADHGFTLVRAYWEPYLTKPGLTSSVCALYITGELNRKKEHEILADLRSFLSFSVNSIQSETSVKDLYVSGQLSFNEMLFAGNAIDFTHLFIYQEGENKTDHEILDSLGNKDHQDAFAKRLQTSNKSIYGIGLIEETAIKHIDLLKYLHELFDLKFNPKQQERITLEKLQEKWREFDAIITSRFIDFPLGYDIFKFMFKIISSTLKTNFYREEKRSFSFRYNSEILDPLVFSQFVFGIFYVNGHYACGTHLRAGDIARGGLRMIRVSLSNYDVELDNAVLLNYALGPKAQRLKHKDICESGSKGVVVPNPEYAQLSMDALYDYTEGIMDLMIPDDSIIDYYGEQELIFFGPDEGTAPLMDAVAKRARERGYKHWRTITTGKTTGIPHDTYGLLDDEKVFGLFSKGEEGVELQIDGKSELVATDMEQIWQHIGNRISLSGMTTTSVMSGYRTLIEHAGEREEELNLMITGGPDGDLGANQIQCYKGKICLVIDGGSILFDPEGLDRAELMKLAFKRNGDPRENSLSFPKEKLSKRGFMVPLQGSDIKLPDGRVISDGALFHRTFLSDPANRVYIKEANIRTFIPCGGFKDTINQNNVKEFLEVFKELSFIVEGANVFFDDVARRHIAMASDILQIKDTTANKGGVFSSSVSEVLTAFLFEDEYEDKLIHDTHTRWELISDIINLVKQYARIEVQTVLKLYDKEPMIPLFDLSEKTSEHIFALQEFLFERIDELLADDELVWKVLKAYIPPVLTATLGREKIVEIINRNEMSAYRNAILTKKLASLALYKYVENWDEFCREAKNDLLPAMTKVMA